MEQFLAEGKVLKLAHLPKDLNGAVTTGARIHLNNVERLGIVVALGTSLASVATFTLRQHNAATAGTSKNLVVANPYFVKADAATKFTKVVPSVAAAEYVLSTTFSTVGGLVVFEVLGEDLDVNGGFSYVSIDIANSTAAKLASTVYVGEPSFKPAFELDV